MPHLYFVALIGICAYSISALFSFLETALTTLRPYQLKELQERVPGYSHLFKIWDEAPQQLFVSVLIMNNFMDIVGTLAVSEVMQGLLGNMGVAIGAAISTVASILLTNIMPKTYARVHYERGVTALLWLISIVVGMIQPFVVLLLQFANQIFLLFGSDVLVKADIFTEEELKYLIDKSDESGVLDAEKSEMLQNVFGLGEILVEKVMVPKSDMVLLDINVSIDKAIEAMRHHRFSRIPVYDGKEDNIVGIMYHKDLFDHFSQHSDKLLKDLVRPVLFTPETKRVSQLLNEFLKKRMHMSIVIDEFGSVIGLVTLEDLIEEIVGEISDEHEKIHTGIIPLEQGGWLINASIMLDKLEEFLAVEFDVEESLTLAGFLSEKFQYLPKNGEQLQYRGYIFTIQQATDKRIFQVLVHHDKPSVITHDVS